MILAFACIVLVSWAVRYPLVDHERYQTDSYFIHFLSRQVVEDGYAKWTLDPLSYFGYYPISYPSAVPFLYAEISQLTGADVEMSILLGNMVFTTIFALVAFCLSREFLNRVEYALLASLLVVLGPRLVDTTYWDGSARGPAVVLITLVVFMSLRYSRTSQMHLLSLVIPASVACFATHHMAVLLILYGAAYLFSSVSSHYSMRMISRRRRGLAVTTSAVGMTVIVLVVFSMLGLLKESFERSFGSTNFLSGESTGIAIVANMLVSYTQQIGLIILPAALGLVVTVWGKYFTVRSLMPMGILIAFIPVLGSTLYVSMLLAPFVVVLGLVGIAFMMRKSVAKSIALVLLLVIVASSVVLPLWSVSRWNTGEYSTGDVVEVDNGLFNDAAYLQSIAEHRYTIASGMGLSTKLSALTDAYLLGSGVQSIVNGDIGADELKDNVTLSESAFPNNLFSLFEFKQSHFIESYVLG